MMNILVGMFRRPARNGANRTSRSVWAGVMTAMLIVNTCLPATAALPHPGTAAKPSESVKSTPIPASARRFAGDAFARLPLGFEAQVAESDGQFLARTDKWNVHLTATEAALVWRAGADKEPSSHSA